MTAPTRVFVPRDTTAQSLGADEVAAAIAAAAADSGADIELVRTGSRGLCWLEPLVEVECDGERLAYGPVAKADVRPLFDAGLLSGGSHALALGPTRDIPYLSQQQRTTFGRCGVIDPLSMDDFVTQGGFAGWHRARAMGAADVIDAVKSSGLRGRGGAGFPAGIKWQHGRATLKADQKYIACNADEGDSGTFSDRILMEGDPFGADRRPWLIAGYAVGASKRLHLPALRISRLRENHSFNRRSLKPRAETQDWLGSDIQGIQASTSTSNCIIGARLLRLRRRDCPCWRVLKAKSGTRAATSHRLPAHWRACSASQPWSTMW